MLLACQITAYPHVTSFTHLQVYQRQAPQTRQYSENTYTLPPTLQPGVENNLIWKRICFTCRNWGYMIFISVDDCHNLHGCPL